MQGKIESLEEQEREPVRKPVRKPWRFRVATGGPAHGCRPAQAIGDELTGLLNRIDLEDYLLNRSLRKKIREMLYRFSDEEFDIFCKKYEKTFFALNKNRRSADLCIEA